MANIKQKIIREKTNEKSRIRNYKTKSRVRTFIKKAKIAIKNNDKDVLKIMNQTNKEIDKSVSKGVFKLGKGSRIKSRIMNMYNKYNNDNKIENVESTKNNITEKIVVEKEMNIKPTKKATTTKITKKEVIVKKETKLKK